jgi:hypothetical protein
VKIDERGPGRCKVCLNVTPHEVIRPVSRGQVYVRCMMCSTVSHFPKRAEVQP